DAACLSPSELQPHLPALCELARQCRHVTGLGTSRSVAVLAFLCAQPEKLICIDPVWPVERDNWQALARQTELVFRQEDALRAELEETDLLFIDLGQDGEPLQQALARQAGKVKKYVALHGASASQGVIDSLAAHGYRLRQHWPQGAGLAVLE